MTYILSTLESNPASQSCLMSIAKEEVDATVKLSQTSRRGNKLRLRQNQVSAALLAVSTRPELTSTIDSLVFRKSVVRTYTQRHVAGQCQTRGISTKSNADGPTLLAISTITISKYSKAISRSTSDALILTHQSITHGKPQKGQTIKQEKKKEKFNLMC